MVGPSRFRVASDRTRRASLWVPTAPSASDPRTSQSLSRNPQRSDDGPFVPEAPVMAYHARPSSQRIQGLARVGALGLRGRYHVPARAPARISHRAVQRASSRVMINVHFRRVWLSRVVVHAEPIAALDALKPASLAL